jgi:hypothetical protein
MPNAEPEFLNIRRHLTTWLTEVSLANASGYFDINKVSEGTALRLLNLVFEFQLADLNRVKNNFPGIDLGDDQKGMVAFQVTSQTDNGKLLSSLETFKANYVQKYPNGIRFFILNHKKTVRRNSPKFASYKDIFDVNKDIIYASDLPELIKHIYYQDQQRFVKISHFLEQEFGAMPSATNAENPLIDFHTPADKLGFYKRILLGNHQTMIQKFISFPCKVDEVDYASEFIQERIFAESGALVIGPSGCGKSIYAKCTALNFLARGIPVILEAKYYEQSLTALMDKEAGACGFESASDLFATAALLNLPVLILIDGFNECPANKKAKLLAELEKLQAAPQLAILITAQLYDPGFLGLKLLQIQVDFPSADTKKAIATSYSGKSLSAKMDPLLNAVSTSLEAKMAGEIANQQIDGLSRFTLFEAFINQKLGAAKREGFLLLAHLAKIMSAKITFSISQRELDNVLQIHHIPGSIYAKTIAAKILEESVGQISFGHELFLNFFTAESIVRFAEDVSWILTEMKSPKNYDNALLIIGSIADTTDLEEVLASQTDVNLLNAISAGEAGGYGKKWIHREVKNILVEIEQEIDHLQYQIDEKEISKIGFVAGTLTPWSNQQYAIIGLIPYLLNRGEYLEQFFVLITKMDQKISQAIQQLWQQGQQQKVGVRYGTFSASYVGISHYKPAITIIFSNLHSGFVTFNNSLAVSGEMIQQLLVKKSLTRGQLYFLLTLFRWDEKVQHLYPYAINVLEKHWQSTPYHLLNEILDKVAFLHKTEPQRKKLIEALNAIQSQTRDIWLSTSIFDGLRSLGALEQDATEYIPIVADEIANLLEQPDSEEKFSHAITLYGSQFDHPYDFAYQAAISNLKPESKQIFYQMALKGLDSPFFASFLLTEAVRTLGESICPLILRWTAQPMVEPTLPQDSLRVFLLSHLILAHYNYPLQSRLNSVDNWPHQSMVAGAELYYWFNRTDLELAEVFTQSKKAQMVLFAPENAYLIDTITELRHTIAQSASLRSFGDFSTAFVDDYFKETIVEAARKAIRQPDWQQKLDSISYGNDPAYQAIYLLEQYGSVVDIQVLRSLSEHPKYGQSAVKAIKELTPKN